MTELPCPNRPWLAVMPTFAPFTWRSPAWPRNCQVSSHTWASAWSRHGLAEAGQATGDIDRNSAAQRGVAAAQPRPPPRPGGELRVLDPVEFQRGGQVVDFRQADITGANARFLVGLEWDGGAITHGLDASGAAESVAISAFPPPRWRRWA